MLTSAQLKQIVSEARPLIERQLDLAEQIAGLREVVSSAGGDWSQLKALVKAQIQDERDDASDGKRVKKILDKADYATAYADMLGLSAFAKMNEENFFADDIPEHDADGVIIEPEAAMLPQTDASRDAGAGRASAEQASVESSATNSPEGASEEVGGFPVAAAPLNSGATGGDEGDQTSQPANVGGASDVTAGETAPHSAPGEDTCISHGQIPVTLPHAPSGVTAAGDGDSADSSPAAVPVADYTKPNPWCLDPEECGLSSWQHFCLACERAKKKALAEGVAA